MCKFRVMDYRSRFYSLLRTDYSGKAFKSLRLLKRIVSKEIHLKSSAHLLWKLLLLLVYEWLLLLLLIDDDCLLLLRLLLWVYD